MSQKQTKWSKIPEDKKPSPEDLGEPQSDDADYDNDDYSLPDRFLPWEPKNPKILGTKEDQDKENTQWTQILQSSFLVMKKPPHSKHSQQKYHHGRSCPANNCSFLFTFSNDSLVP